MTTNTNAKTPAIRAEIDEAGESMTLTFSNGKSLELALAQLTPDMATKAMWHGLKQKLVDAAAMSCNPDTGRAATIDDKYNAVAEVYDRLITGEWNKTREGGGNSGGLLFRALCEVYANKTPEQVKIFLSKKDAKEKATLRDLPKIAAIIARIKSESAKAGAVDTDALLEGLED